MVLTKNKRDLPCTTRAKANHPRVFTNTRCKTKRSTTRTTKQIKKLQVDAHTKKGVWGVNWEAEY